ncbi:MAG: AtpZ/AtpI family protein [Chitinophagaceae bacterium]
MFPKETWKYAGLATQFLATLGVAFFIGFWIDKKMQFRIPIVALLLSVAMLFYNLWKIYKDVSKNEK